MTMVEDMPAAPPASKAASRERTSTEDQGHADLEAARAVLALESGALRALSDSLGDAFIEAVDAILKVRGKVIVTGMGKSGHIGNKIAATLASTGTSAIAVHPGEASHGDLGMLGDDDLVIALSNSGNTAELKDLIAFTQLRRLTLIGIVGVADSMLAESATIPLVLPTVPEACPLGLAPTTSTTMMLALGDALAVTLMHRRGFSADQYHTLHPGGRLGQRFIKVEDLMSRGDDVPLVTPETDIATSVQVMTDKGKACVGVVDAHSKLLGVITDGDLRRHMGGPLFQRAACDVMTKTPIIIGPKSTALEALSLLNENKIICLFVVDDGTVVGIIHVHDILRAGIT